MTTNDQVNANDIKHIQDHYVSSSVVPGCVSLRLPGPFSNISAIFEIESRALEVTFKNSIQYYKQAENSECKTHIQILDMVSYHLILTIKYLTDLYIFVHCNINLYLLLYYRLNQIKVTLHQQFKKPSSIVMRINMFLTGYNMVVKREKILRFVFGRR